MELDLKFGAQLKRDIYFTGNNCTGDAYVLVKDGIGPGWVIQASDKDQYNNTSQTFSAFYVPIDANATDVHVSYRLRGGNCSNNTIGATSVIKYPVFPNDPAITGMPNELYTMPIRPVK